MKVKTTSILLLLLVFTSMSAKADTLTADFTTVTTGVRSGTLQIDVSGGSATFTVSAAPGYDLLVQTVPDPTTFPGYVLVSVFDFNVVGSTDGLSVTRLPTGWSVNTTPYVCGPFCLDEAILGAPNVTQALTSLQFTVTRNGGFSSTADFLEWNAKPYAFTARLLPVRASGLPVTRDQWSGAVPTPEPASLFLFISGLAGMGAVVRQRRRKALWASMAPTCARLVGTL